MPQDEAPALTPGRYADLVEGYAGGEVFAIGRALVAAGHRALAAAQEGFLEASPPGTEPRGFRLRFFAALMHAETAGRLGNQNAFFFRLIDPPLRTLPEVWPPGVPQRSRDALRRSWGGAASAPLPRTLSWELHLAAARRPLGILDLHTAGAILASAPDPAAPPIAWQRAALLGVQARYLLQQDYWPEFARMLVASVAARGFSNADGERSDHPLVQAMGDPDDLRLRLAMAALGSGDRVEAHSQMRALRDPVAPRLWVPRRLLEVELDLGDRGAENAAARLVEAARGEPPSGAATAALVMALHQSGRSDEAAELATDHLAGRDRSFPWMRFLSTWADGAPSRFDWLRALVPA